MKKGEEVVTDIICKDYDKVLDKITKFIRKYSGNRPVCIGLSGGIDSTLCAYLAYKAIGKKNVHGIISPSRYTPEADVKDAKIFASKICGKILMIPRRKIDVIRKAYDYAMKGEGEAERIIMDAYIRNNLLRRYSRLNGVRQLGTINGTEWRLGYYPKYVLIGDMLPIADLYKTQVFELSEFLGLPREIIEKKPTLGLGCSPKVKEERKSKIDEELIRAKLSYPKLDIILAGIDNKFKNKHILKYAIREKMRISNKQINIVRKLVNMYKHKAKLPPYPKINPGTVEHCTEQEEYEEH